MSPRAGVGLVEVLTALLAGAIACAAMAATLRTEERLARVRAERLQRRETVRIAATVLRQELAFSDPLADVGGGGRDSLAVRLFRGVAITCAASAGGMVPVSYAGERLPDPAKDSVLVLPGGSPPLPLQGVAPATAACAGPGDVLALQLGAALPAGVPLLLFQRGIYALSGQALRVRHGREGRQPLTAEVLDDAPTRLTLQRGPGGEVLRVEAVLAFRGVGTRRRLRLTLLNGFARPTAPP